MLTRDDIIRMAMEARLTIRGHYDDYGSTPLELDRFAELVAASEREACAKVCEEATNGTNCHMIGYGFAEAIRNRK